MCGVYHIGMISGFPSQRAINAGFDVFFDVVLNKANS